MELFYTYPTTFQFFSFEWKFNILFKDVINFNIDDYLKLNYCVSVYLDLLIMLLQSNLTDKNFSSSRIFV